eukprot:2414478-Rhodomonas_salina.1
MLSRSRHGFSLQHFIRPHLLSTPSKNKNHSKTRKTDWRTCTDRIQKLRRYLRSYLDGPVPGRQDRAPPRTIPRFAFPAMPRSLLDSLTCRICCQTLCFCRRRMSQCRFLGLLTAQLAESTDADSHSQNHPGVVLPLRTHACAREHTFVPVRFCTEVCEWEAQPSRRGSSSSPSPSSPPITSTCIPSPQTLSRRTPSARMGRASCRGARERGDFFELVDLLQWFELRFLRVLLLLKC